MNENESKEQVASDSPAVNQKPNGTTEVSYTAMQAEKSGASKLVWYVLAFAIVVLVLTGVLYVMEKQGRASTGIFDSVIATQNANTVVAVVNGKKIVQSDLDISITQFGQAAAAQGVDVESPEVKKEIVDQSLEVLVNTELLRQAAVASGIEITKEEVETRLTEIETEIGGADVLAGRMETLGIDQEQLYRDIKNEMLIKQLFDTKFADTTVTDAEITEMYEAAGASGAELPELETVRPQIEEQIRASKEQVIIDDYLKELKADATIEIR